MGWEVFVFDLPRDAKCIEDIPKDFRPPPIGKRSHIIDTILSVLPSMDFSNPALGKIDVDNSSIEVSIGPEDPCRHFAFDVHGGGATFGIIAEILDKLNVRAVSPETDGFFVINDEHRTYFEQWKRNRDQVVVSDNNKDNT